MSSAGSGTQVSTAFVGHDQLTPIVRQIAKEVTGLNKIFGHLHGTMKLGFEFKAGEEAFDLFAEGIHKVVDFLPDMIEKGVTWANTVEHVAQVSGLSAEMSSKVASAQQQLAGTADGLEAALAQMAKNIAKHPEILKKYHVAITDVNGSALSMDKIFLNLRERMSTMVSASDRAALASGVLGRGWRSMGILLTETEEAWQRQITVAKESGVVLTHEGLMAARTFELAKHQIDTAFIGISSQVFQGAAPALIGMTNAVTQAIRDNMSNIVNFVTGAINLVAGIVSGFLGVNLSAAIDGGHKAILTEKEWRAQQPLNQDAALKTAAAQKQATSAIESQIKAIDRQLARLDRGNQRAAARRQYEQTMADIHTARRELEGIRSETFLKSRMSEADWVLAKQDQAARAAAASKKVIEAQKAAEQARREQETARERDRLTAQRDHLQEMLQGQRDAQARQKAQAGLSHRDLHAGYVAYRKSMTGEGKTLGDEMTTQMKKTAEDAQRFGKQIAGSILDAFLGPETTVSLGSVIIKSRSGGIIRDIQNLGTELGKLAKQVADFVAWINTLIPKQGSGKSLEEDPLGLGDVQKAADIVAHVFDSYGTRPGENDVNGGYAEPTRSGGPAGYRGGPINERPKGPLTWYDLPGATGPGTGMATNPFERIFRRYLGTGSPVTEGVDSTRKATEDGTGWMALTSDNTSGIAPGGPGIGIADWMAGTLGVGNSQFSDIGSINDVKGSNVFRVDNASGTHLGIWPTGGKPLPTHVNNKLQVESIASKVERAVAEVRWNRQHSDLTKLLDVLKDIRNNTGGHKAPTRSSSTKPT